MDNKTFGIASNKFFYFAMNYRYGQVALPNWDGTETMHSAPTFLNAFDLHIRTHLLGKWNAYYDTYGGYGVLMAFYADLDGTNRAKLLKWINENYELADANGISLTTLEK